MAAAHIQFVQQVDSLSSIRLFIPKDLLPQEARENTLKKVSEVLSRFSKDGIPLLDPEEDMKVSWHYCNSSVFDLSFISKVLHSGSLLIVMT